MRPELTAYFDLAKAEQPNWLTEEFSSLCRILSNAHADDAWFHGVRAFRAQVDYWVTTGKIAGNSAASVLFIADALEVARAADGGAGGYTVLGYVLELTLSQAQWSNFLKVAAADGVVSGEGDDEPMRLPRFHDQVLIHFAKRARFAVIRDLYRLVRFRIDEIARRAMRSAKDFDSWVGDLALLAAHLTLRRWLPLTEDKEGESGGGTIEIAMGNDGNATGARYVGRPQIDLAILAKLFDSQEIQTLHRKEAYAAECFAHLFNSIYSGCVTEDHQKELYEEYHRRAEQDWVGARQWLALGKSRFTIAPYL
jgi:hypothetical protein